MLARSHSFVWFKRWGTESILHFPIEWIKRWSSVSLYLLFFFFSFLLQSALSPCLSWPLQLPFEAKRGGRRGKSRENRGMKSQYQTVKRAKTWADLSLFSPPSLPLLPFSLCSLYPSHAPFLSLSLCLFLTISLTAEDLPHNFST